MGATPNGLCWCDCGGEAKPGSYFLQGHDKRADRYLQAIDGSQSIADKLDARQFVPGLGKSLRDAVLAVDPAYETCGLKRPDGLDCRVIGKGAGMRRHRAAADQHST